jgi:hypothetical protein
MTVDELIQEYEQRLVTLQGITTDCAELPMEHWGKNTRADRYTFLEGARIMETSYNNFLQKLRRLNRD